MNNNQDRVVESDKVLELAALGAHYGMAARAAPLTAYNDPHGVDPREVRRALTSSIAWLVDNQSEEGFWAGRVESNSCIEAEWLIDRLPGQHGSAVGAMHQPALFEADEVAPDARWRGCE